jgi:hypothetical protein
MNGQQTGKQRAARIPLDYYKRPNWLERWKGWLALLALVVTAGWVAAGFFQRGGGTARYSRGPVAAVHAAWNDRCEACHADFSPVSSRGVGVAFHGTDLATDANCKTCHAGPPHHPNQKADASLPSCGACHRDHRGTDASLVRLADADCTQCHAGLKAHASDPAKVDSADAVTAFATAHPDFAPLKKPDPGKLKFNHKLHMTPGQAEGKDPSESVRMTLGEIADKDLREYYRNQPWQKDHTDNKDAVILDCFSCHRLDKGDFAGKGRPHDVNAAAMPTRAAGAYVLPVSYETSCKACHPLTFDPNLKGKDGAPVSVPHHLQPAEVDSFLWGAYVDAYLNRKGGAAEPKPAAGPDRPLPGKPTRAEAEAQARRDVEKVKEDLFAEPKGEAKRAATYVLSGKTTCGECHSFEEGGKRIAPPNVPDVWFTKAKFNHASHRALDCKGCHAAAYTSAKSEDVLLPDVANCRQCHSPAHSGTDGQPAGGVRHDCTECHTYHGLGDPGRLQGLGAAARDPKPRQPDVEKFLTGTPADKR